MAERNPDSLVEVGVYRRPAWLDGCDDVARLRRRIASIIGSSPVVRIRGELVEVQVKQGLIGDAGQVLGDPIEVFRASRVWSWPLYTRSLRIGSFWFAHTVAEVLWRGLGVEAGRWLAGFAGALALVQECRNDAAVKVLSRVPRGIVDPDCVAGVVAVDVFSGFPAGEKCLRVEGLEGVPGR